MVLNLYIFGKDYTFILYFKEKTKNIFRFMEKVAALIDKLQELKNEGAELNKLSYYTQMLYAELMCVKGFKERQSMGKKKVSVIMPGQTPPVKISHETIAPEPPSWPQKPTAIKKEEVISQEEKPYSEKVKEEIKAAPAAREPIIHETPDLFQQPRLNGQQRKKELNDLIAEQKPSLNDKLKFEKVELGSKLSNTPVQDLHKAIGINDKFQFINELFRGDPNIYERSLKTINECKNLQEAQYWIERELKIKFGWLDQNPSVQQFYAIVRKRFS